MKDEYIEIQTASPEKTRAVGMEIGKYLPAGVIVALMGDLGSGKTVFVQGLAKGIGVSDKYYVTSPTYTLINEYPAKHPLFHIDLYRMDGGADFEDIGLHDILSDNNGIIVIEWPERLDPSTLSDCLTIRFEVMENRSRHIRIASCGLVSDNLIGRLKKMMREKQWA